MHPSLETLSRSPRNGGRYSRPCCPRCQKQSRRARNWLDTNTSRAIVVSDRTRIRSSNISLFEISSVRKAVLHRLRWQSALGPPCPSRSLHPLSYPGGAPYLHTRRHNQPAAAQHFEPNDFFSSNMSGQG
jgi:hypothetical protein